MKFKHFLLALSNYIFTYNADQPGKVGNVVLIGNSDQVKEGHKITSENNKVR